MKKKIIFISVLGVILLGAAFAGGFYLKTQTTPPPVVENVEGTAQMAALCDTLGQEGTSLAQAPTSSLEYNLSQICKEVRNPNGVDFSLFWQAWNQIQEKYVSRNNLDTQAMVYGAISGMVNSLGDPYTVFFPPKDAQRFQEDVQGTFQGVGMEIGVKNNQLQVIAPLESTPAQKAGLRAGDAILKIDGTSTEGMTPDQAANLIRGPSGTTVTLSILRSGWTNPKDFVITRAQIEVPSVKLEFKTLPDGSQVAYVTIYQFTETAYNDFNNIAVQILNSQAKKIILDLRDNPGGYLEVAQGIAGWFLPKGDLVVTEDFGNGQKNQQYLAQGPGSLSNYPMVVLINGGSASASEILAGALRDDRGIQLIGEKSFGKGSVQELSNMPDGSSIKITVAHWLTPKGNQINDVGLSPDVKVPMTDQDISQGKDPQLDKAIEIIGGL